MRLVKFSYVLAICALLVFKPSAVIGFNVYEEMVASNYNFSAWKDRTTSTYIRNVEQWDWNFLNLPTNGVNCIAYKSNSDGWYELSISDSDARNIFAIDVIVHTNVCSAHAFIVNRFSFSTSTVKWLPYTSDLGDVAFYNPLRRNCSSLIFAKNNVAVIVRSFVDYLSATNVAYQIDADILSKSRRE